MSVPDETVIFVDGKNGDNNNDAKTPENAVKDLDAAFRLLCTGRETIVISGSVPLKTKYSTPSYDGTVIISSMHGGVDYNKKNGAMLQINKAVSFNSDVVLENIRLTSSVRGASLCFNFHNATIGEGVKTTKGTYREMRLFAGYYVEDLALNAAGHTTAKKVSGSGTCSISVNSGKWSSVVGGNYRIGYNSPIGTFDGDMTISIGGEAEIISAAKADDIEGVAIAGSGHNIAKGSVTLNITGGVIDAPIYGIGKLGRYYNYTADNGKNGTDGTQFGKDVRYEADVFVNITGGDLSGSNAPRIAAIQVPGDTTLHGSYTLNVSGVSLPEKFSFSGFGVMGKASASGIDTASADSFDSINGTLTNDQKPIRIACCGDSITFGTGAVESVVRSYTYAKENYFYPTQMQKLYGTSAVVGNFGYPGSYVGTSYNKYLKSCVYNSMIAFEPDIIVLALGTNNSSLMPSGQQQFIENYRIMIEDMHSRFPNAKIIMTTAIYRFDIAERIDQMENYIIPAQKQIAEEYDYVYLYDAYTEYKPYGNTTYYKDKLHPNNTGYVKLAEVMKKAVDTLLSVK